MVQMDEGSSHKVLDSADAEPSRPTSVAASLLKKLVSSLVVFSYLSLSLSQSYAMDGKVVPFDGHEGIQLGASYNTPKKFKQNTVMPSELDSPTSVKGLLDEQCLDDIENALSANSLTNDVQQEKKVIDSSSLRDAEGALDTNVKRDASLPDPLAAFGKAFELDGSGMQLMDLFKTGYLAVSFSIDSLLNAPQHIANTGIWIDGSLKKLWNRDGEMPREEAYSTYSRDFYRDNAYYGGHKDTYMQSLLTTILFGSVVYAINAKAKFAGYTIFDAMAKKAEMYELLYYQHADDTYYYYDQFTEAMTIYSWRALPFFLFFESSELSKIFWPTKEESQLKERQGFYTEHVLNFLSVGIAFAAGYFAYSAYYTAASGLLGTSKTTEKDLTTYPAFLGYSTALTMYTIARKGSDNAYRYLSRQQYGDKAGRERGMNEDAIDFYKESMNKKFKAAKVTPEEEPSVDAKLKLADGVDVESHQNGVQKENKRTTLLDSSQTTEELEASLATLNGTEFLTEILDHWFNHKSTTIHRKSHDLAAIKKLQEQSEASLSTQFMKGTYNSTAWVGNNSWWIVPTIVCAALVYPSFASCVELVQWSIKGEPQAISDYVFQQQQGLKYEILKSYESKILADPVKWQTDCFDSMKISETVTDDENFYQYYYESNYNQTADYILHFTTPHCLGIAPFDEWVSAPKDLEINYDNALMWFDLLKNYYASYTDVEMTFSKITNILAYSAAGIYTPAVYGLSVLGTSFVLYQGAEIFMNPKLTVCSRILSILGNTLVSTPAFTQGVIESAPQAIEGYLVLDGEFSDWAVYACTGLITAVSALILTPDFYSVQERIVGKVAKLFYGRSSHKELLRKFDTLKELNDSAKPEILKNFYKIYEK